jgi:hypothetical protein
MATKAQLKKLQDALKKAEANLAKVQSTTASSRTDSAASAAANDYLGLGPLGGLGAGVVAGVNPPARTDSAATRAANDYLNLGPLGGLGAGVVAGVTGADTSGNNPPASTPKPSEKYAGLVALLSSYGINKIADMVDKVLVDYPESDGDEILNLLRYDPRYNKPYLERFAGNAERLKNKVPLLDEATYLKQELGYSKMFKAYGLTNLDNTAQYTKLIGADIDIDEATTRVSMATDRVLNAESSTKNAFLRFFPMLSNQDLVAAMLNPEEQLPALERKVQSAEIGGAALRQGLTAELADTTTKSAMYSNVQAGTVGAGTLETAGVTAASAVKSYGTIASELPTMEKLSSIYGSTLDQYGQREAEQADLLGLASAKRKKERLIAREEAQYQGSAGTMKGSFGSQNSF